LRSSHETNNNQLDLWLPRKGSCELERQFAELSAICSGKDAIIESQRRQLQTERKANEDMERLEFLFNKSSICRLNEKLNVDIKEWEQKWKMLDQELNLLRGMSNQQDSMNNRVGSISFYRTLNQSSAKTFFVS
jgi:hypothetical protein